MLGEDDFNTSFRRNSFKKLPVENHQSNTLPLARAPLTRSHSVDPPAANHNKLNPKARKTLQFINGTTLPRRLLLNETDDTSEDSENCFGYRHVLENKTEVTAITATTIATCVSKAILELIEDGEKRSRAGHFNSSRFDIFCGGGKNPRASNSPKPLKDESHDIPVTSPKSNRKIFPRSLTDPPLPSLKQIETFISKLCNDTQMEYECIVISLIYVRRLLRTSNGDMVLLSDNWKGVVIACAMLANKVWDDFHMRNLDYTYLFKGLTVNRVNKLELQLLLCMEFRCNVSPSLYAQTHFEVQATITRMSIDEEKIKRIMEKKTSLSKVFPFSPRSKPRPMRPTGVSAKSDEESDGDDLFPMNSKSADDENNAVVLTCDTSSMSIDEYATSSPGPVPVQLHAISENAQPVPKGSCLLDLNNETNNFVMHVKYDEASLIKPPKQPPVKGEISLSNRPKSFKLSKERSRKSFGQHDLSPPPSPSKTESKITFPCCPFVSYMCGTNNQNMI